LPQLPRIQEMMKGKKKGSVAMIFGCANTFMVYLSLINVSDLVKRLRMTYI